MPKKKAEAKKKEKKGSGKDKPLDFSRLACPCCGKHCALSKPKCGKGKAIVRKMSKKG